MRGRREGNGLVSGEKEEKEEKEEKKEKEEEEVVAS